MTSFLALTQDTTISISVMLAVSSILITLGVKIINSLTAQSYKMGRIETRLDVDESDIKELKESHSSVWKYLMRFVEFRNTLDRKDG